MDPSEEEREQIDFCRREYPRVFGALILFTGSRAKAEELTQEAMLRVLSDWSRMSHIDAPGAWIHRIAINLAKSRAARVRREVRALIRLGRPTDIDTESDPADAIAVRAALQQLAPRQRAALVLRYYSGLNVAEAAEALGCERGTVRALCHQGITKLREQLGAAGPVREEAQHEAS